MRLQKGFTLIELMIVIAIVGVLASFAIPAYQNYTVRARVTEGLNLAAAAKLAVSEVTMTNNALPNDQKEAGYVSPAPTVNVASVTIAGNNTGEITIRFTPLAGNGTIVLVPTLEPTGDVTWACNEGSLAAKYRPAACR